MIKIQHGGIFAYNTKVMNIDYRLTTNYLKIKGRFSETNVSLVSMGNVLQLQ
jgi:hypothetical protein